MHRIVSSGQVLVFQEIHTIPSFSTDLWHNITENNIIPSISQVIEGTEVYPMILGDSAFPFRVWLIREALTRKMWQEKEANELEM